MAIGIDISENEILERLPRLLEILLIDRTSSMQGEAENISWASHDYEKLGLGYHFDDPILPELITGKNNLVIRPRILKSREHLVSRVREMAEVFTPSWICNIQNNLIDNEWFGREHVFNREYVTKDGIHSWETNLEKISFPKGKTWGDYISDKRIEISCGEAPYLASRYDLTTGLMIPVPHRIGLLDRKLRVVSENTGSEAEWIKSATDAFKSVYGYEWQGDSLLLARESLLFSFIEYFSYKFDKLPDDKSITEIATIISWNLWQMDGLKGVRPNSCHDSVQETISLFGEVTQTILPCEGCQKNNIYSHNGKYCYIIDWTPEDVHSDHKEKIIRYIDTLR